MDRLHRCRDRRIVAGVAAGVADYLGVDATLVRIGFIVLALLGGIAVPLYLAGWLLIPDEGTDYSIAEDLFAPDGPR
jgi:phage shock protein PspC (stress-responsive transcriptional regulator)